MTEKLRTATVKLSEEEASASRIFAERSILHARANKKEWGEIGDVFIADEKEHKVAWTTSVSVAVRNGRLVVIGEEEAEIKGDQIDITEAAEKMAKEAKIDLLKVQPTGRGGTQITKGDVQRFIKANK